MINKKQKKIVVRSTGLFIVNSPPRPARGDFTLAGTVYPPETMFSVGFEHFRLILDFALLDRGKGDFNVVLEPVDR